MSFERIKQLVPNCPTFPREETIDWKDVENTIKIGLPLEYKKFISHFGTGSIGNFLWVFNPLASNINLNLSQHQYFHDAYNTMKELFPEDYMRPDFPDQNSFLTWAATDNGDSFFWIVEGKPDDWVVGVHSHDQGDEEISGKNTSDFLLSLFSHQLTSNILPKDFLEGSLSFKAV
jgi:hypothetical protein